MLDCSSRSEPRSKIDWYRGETLIDEAKNEEYLKLKNVKRSDSGKYTCIVSNVLGKKERTWTLQVGRKYIEKKIYFIKYL